MRHLCLVLALFSAGKIADGLVLNQGPHLRTPSGPSGKSVSNPASAAVPADSNKTAKIQKQDSDENNSIEDYSAYCGALTKGVERGPTLSRVCQFAMTLNDKLPSVVCSLQTMRYRDHGFGATQLIDTVTADVSYEDGHEHYQNFSVNGEPEPDGPRSIGGWSTGDFATHLHDIFTPESQPEFKFKKTEKLRSQPVAVFEFHVARKNNQLWFIQAGRERVYPGYRGKLWVNLANSQLMRLETRDIELDSPFPLTYFKSEIDYSEMQLGDGTSLVLAERSETVACRGANSKPCYRNLVTFSNWHKFIGKARIVGDESYPQNR